MSIRQKEDKWTNVKVSTGHYPASYNNRTQAGKYTCVSVCNPGMITAEYEINPETGYIGPKIGCSLIQTFNLNDYAKIKE